MIRFSSALYLGLQHPSHSLGGWEGLTTGVPAAFAEARLVTGLEIELAVLTGCALAVLARSTLHAFWDLLDMIATTGHDILLDSGAYAVARWGVERAACRGARVRAFPTHDVAALRRAMRSGRPAAVVTDGIDAFHGTPAPLGEYAAAAARTGGIVIVDDTQALGLLGRRENVGAFGRGGGGSVRWHGLEGGPVLLVASLAKAFGSPLTMISGEAAVIRGFKERSRTRVYCSPPSLADLASARRALRINARCGEVLRARLERNVRRFRAALRREGMSSRGGVFPVQTLDPLPGIPAPVLHERLRGAGVETVLRSTRCGARVCFILNAAHTPEQLHTAVSAIVGAAAPTGKQEGAFACHGS